MSENVTDSEESLFISKNKILFKKYKVIKKLCSGAFSKIYLGISISNGFYVAIKVEPRKIPNPHLETEAYFLYYLKGKGIPWILSYGRTKDYNILIEPFLGKSLYHLYTENNNHFSIKDICLIGIQLIDRLEWIHSKDVIHRDIKPDNCLIGEKYSNILYLIDFGLSSKFRSSSSGKHIKFGFTGKLTGTTKYSSANSIRGGEQSRKDDLESLIYMIIFFLKGSLPWEYIESDNEDIKCNKIYLMKKNITSKKLCKGLPEEIYKLLEYVKELKFEEKPDYNYMRTLFKDLLLRFNYDYNDKFTFSWVKSKPLINNFSRNTNKRKSNFHNRLFKTIKKNLENKDNFNKLNNNNSFYNKGINNTNRTNKSKNKIVLSYQISKNNSLMDEKRSKSYKNNMTEKEGKFWGVNKNKNLVTKMNCNQNINSQFNVLGISSDYGNIIKNKNNILTYSLDYGFKINNKIFNLDSSSNYNYNINNNNIYIKINNKYTSKKVKKNKKCIKDIPIPNKKKINEFKAMKDGKNDILLSFNNNIGNYTSILNKKSQNKNIDNYINLSENKIHNNFNKLNIPNFKANIIGNMKKSKLKSITNCNRKDNKSDNKSKKNFHNNFKQNFANFPEIRNNSFFKQQNNNINKSVNKIKKGQNFNELFYKNTINNFNII